MSSSGGNLLEDAEIAHVNECDNYLEEFQMMKEENNYSVWRGIDAITVDRFSHCVAVQFEVFGRRRSCMFVPVWKWPVACSKVW